MPGSYVVALKIYYPAGTALADINVSLRNESTNERKTKTTNAAGEAVFNLGDPQEFPSGFTVGDKFTYYVIYQGYEGYQSGTVARAGGTTISLVLSELAAAPSLRYFSPQEFLDFFNLEMYDSTDEATADTHREYKVKLQRLVQIGEGVEQEIDSETNTKFDNNSGSYYSRTEYIDTNRKLDSYFLSRRPVVSITTFATTQLKESSTLEYPNDTSDWSALTEDTNFMLDSDTGRVVVVTSSNKPITRRRGIYADYKYGRSTVPNDIKMLAMVWTAQMMGVPAAFLRNRIVGMTDHPPSSDSNFDAVFNNYKNKVLDRYRIINIANTVDNGQPFAGTGQST